MVGYGVRIIENPTTNPTANPTTNRNGMRAETYFGVSAVMTLASSHGNVRTGHLRVQHGLHAVNRRKTLPAPFGPPGCVESILGP